MSDRAIGLRGTRLSCYWRFISFEKGAVLEAAESLIRSNDYLLPVLKAAEYFDVGCASDAGRDGHELGALLSMGVFVDHVNALYRRRLA